MAPEYSLIYYKYKQNNYYNKLTLLTLRAKYDIMYMKQKSKERRTMRILLISLLMLLTCTVSAATAASTPLMPAKTLKEMSALATATQQGLCSGSISSPGTMQIMLLTVNEHFMMFFTDSALTRFVMGTWAGPEMEGAPESITSGTITADGVLQPKNVHPFDDAGLDGKGPCSVVYPYAT